MHKEKEAADVIVAVDIEKNIPPLRESVNACLENYMKHLGGHPPSDVYKMVVEEVELSLFKFIMKQVRGNQCRAAEWLGINRGTLRKKLKQYHLI